MNTKNTKISLLNEEEKRKIIDKIIGYFSSERNEEIGVIAATNLLEFIEQEIVPTIYNQAVDDVSVSLKSTLEEIEYKLNELRKDIS